MRLLKITIIGNSLGLRNRPHAKEQSKNYGQLIEQQLNLSSEDILCLVNNLAFGRATMRDLLKIHDQIINSFADLYIINIGASDAATRDIPRWFADIINGRKESIFKAIMKAIYRIFFMPFRKYWVVIRGKRPWTSKKTFKRLYKDLLYKIQNNTSGKVICISINRPSDRVERILPGSTKNYAEYSDIIKQLSLEYEVFFLDLTDLKPDTHYPDGTHFSEQGNKEVVNRILDLIEKNDVL